ncbi:haloacid dehalogenase [Morchella conica CCBAS932]|uniref:Haloacid dehalogenase n=1 Tax=Morchella conica CCBAS932 TaxID=1392247 RepID=A0A3N4KPC0_9PEZI|nr:haloacid dehalogenase [Morchella conica CCBAS932]
MSEIKVLAFDLYGTILDTSSTDRKLKEIFPSSESSKVHHVVQQWRRYQLEYTWRLNSMGAYKSFDEVTYLSLSHAAKESGISLSKEQLEEVVASYNTLSPYPDAVKLFQELPGHIKALVFSNGTPRMLSDTFSASEFLKDVKYLSVDSAKCFKPDPRTYQLLVQHHNMEGEAINASEVYLVSGNPFDIVGAAAAGLGTIWIDRAGKGWQDGLGAPAHSVMSLEEVKGVVEKCKGKSAGAGGDPCCGRG